MEGNKRFNLDSSTVEPEHTRRNANGRKGNHSGPTFDRSGSFRKCGEARSFPAGNGSFQSVGQHIGGSSTSLQSLLLEKMPTVNRKKPRLGKLMKTLSRVGVNHSKPGRDAAVEDLKQMKETFCEINNQARDRAKKLNEKLHKLDKICEVLSFKKQQRTESSSKERSSGSNLMSVAQAEASSNGISRMSLVATKDLDLLRDSVSQPDLLEEMISQLPAGRSWNQKMKRKRSVSKVLTRSLNISGNLKQSMHKSIFKEGGSQRNVSLSGCEENNIGNTSPVKKKKASRTPRGDPATGVNSSTNIRRLGAPEICKQSTNLNKTRTSIGINNKKHSVPSGLTSSMTRCPVSNLDDNSPVEGNGDYALRKRRKTVSSCTLSIPNTSSMRDKKKKNAATADHPLRSLRPSTDKNESELADFKGFYHKGHVPNGGPPDITGESNDDCEELLTSSSFASNPSYLVGADAFWKKMEILFPPVSSNDISYLAQQQLQVEEKLEQSLPQMPRRDSNCLDDSYVAAASEAVEINGVKQKEAVNSIVSFGRCKEFESPPERSGSKKGSNKHMPLYQRVLSALIEEEDEIEELGESGTERSAKLQEKIEFSHKVQGLSGFCRNSLDGSLLAHSNGFGNSYSDNEYGQLPIDDKVLLELHNIGIYPETMPDLDDHDDRSLEDTIQLYEDDHRQQVVKTKDSVAILHGEVLRRKEEEKGALEQVAMDRLVELTYKRLQDASKWENLAFAKRTLSRCQALEDTGVSCFTEKPFRDVLFAAPIATPLNETEPTATPLNETEPTATPLNETEPTATPHDKTEPTRSPDSNCKHYEQPGPSGNLNKGSSDLFGTCQKSDNGLSVGISVQHRTKKKDLLLDKKASGRVNGKRKARGRPNGNDKTKTNPKQKTTRQVSSRRKPSVNNKVTETDQKKDGGRRSNLKKTSSASKDKTVEEEPLDKTVEEEEPLDLANFPLPEFDTLDKDLTGTDMCGGGQQDLTSWLNCDDFQDKEDLPMVGLDIPDDDIGSLNLF